jgi:membrane protease YdiL (CAAX protease family)
MGAPDAMNPKHRGIAAYIAIAYGVAWAAWEASFQLDGATSQLVFYLGAFAPALAAIIVRKWVTREGFEDAGLAVDVRAWPYYVIAWVLPLAVVLVIAAEAMAFSIADPDFSSLTALRAMHHELPANLVPYSGFLMIVQELIRAVMFTPVLWGEEFGWRGYLQPRLAPGRPLVAAVLTGIIWSVWHYPLILRGYNYPENPWLGLLLFPVTSIALSIIFGWLRENSGSIWAPSLAHSSINAVGGSLSVLWFYGMASQTWVGVQGILAWLPLGAVCAWVIWSQRKKTAAGKAG